MAFAKLPSSTRSTRTLLWISIGVFITYFSLLSVMRHQNMYSLRLDLGNMDQTVWNLAHGHGFTLTDPMSSQQRSRLAYHADFFLMLFVPFYLLWSHPDVLLIAQALIIGLGALPIYWIGQKILKNSWLALLFAVAYLLYPALERTLMYDFHAVSLAISFLLFAYWYMDSQRWGLFFLFSLLASLCKEDLWLTTALMGGSIAIRSDKKLFGISIVLGSLCIFYLLIWHVIPSLAATNQHFALKYLSDFGDNPTSIVGNLMIRPGSVIATALLPDRWWYLVQLLVPVSFLPLLAPGVLLFALPDLAINLLSNNGLMRSIDYQYNSVIIPFLFIAAMNGYVVLGRWANAHRKFAFIRRFRVDVLIITIATTSYMWGVLPYQAHSLWWLYFRQPPGYATIKSVIRTIPTSATVSVTNNLGAQVSQRQFLYNFPVNAHSADFVLVKLDDKNAWPSLWEQRQVEASLYTDPSYELIAREASFSAFRRIVFPTSVGIQE